MGWGISLTTFLYAVILAALIWLVSCGQVRVNDTSEKPAPPPVVLEGVSLDSPDWTKAETHRAEVESTIRAVDSGVEAVNKAIGESTIASQGTLHRARAEYLQTRAALLYHLYNLTPPVLFERVPTLSESDEP